MGKGGRQKATGGSVAWTNLTSSGLLEKGRMGRCTKPRTRIQVKIILGSEMLLSAQLPSLLLELCIQCAQPWQPSMPTEALSGFIVAELVKGTGAVSGGIF